MPNIGRLESTGRPKPAPSRTKAKARHISGGIDRKTGRTPVKKTTPAEPSPASGVAGRVPGALVAEKMSDSKNIVNFNKDANNAFVAEISPILSDLPPAPVFPMKALGPKFKETVLALQTLSGGAPLELCVMVLLGAVNFAVQGLMNIRIHLLAISINLYLLGVGASGERKTTLMRLVRGPIDAMEDSLRRDFEMMIAELSQTKSNIAKAMRPPVLVLDEASPSALRRLLYDSANGVLGLFLDEAGLLLNGYGMSKDLRTQMITMLSKLHDGESIKIVRNNNTPSVIANKRFSMAIMGQWRSVSAFLGDKLCQSQGLLSRILVAYPKSTRGRRKTYTAKELAAAEKVLDRYRSWMRGVLDCEPHLVPGTVNEINPPTMGLSAEAREILQRFSREMEEYCVRVGSEHPILDHVNKMPELAARVAATMQLFETGGAGTLGADHAGVNWVLDADHMSRGVELIRFFIEEKERLIAPAPESRKREDAGLLLLWMREQGLTAFTRSEVYSGCNKGCLRDKRTLDGAISVMMDYGWLACRKLPRNKGAVKAATQYTLTDAGIEKARRDTAA